MTAFIPRFPNGQFNPIFNALDYTRSATQTKAKQVAVDLTNYANTLFENVWTQLNIFMSEVEFRSTINGVSSSFITYIQYLPNIISDLTSISFDTATNTTNIGKAVFLDTINGVSATYLSNLPSIPTLVTKLQNVTYQGGSNTMVIGKVLFNSTINGVSATLLPNIQYIADLVRRMANVTYRDLDSMMVVGNIELTGTLNGVPNSFLQYLLNIPDVLRSLANVSFNDVDATMGIGKVTFNSTLNGVPNSYLQYLLNIPDVLSRLTTIQYRADDTTTLVSDCMHVSTDMHVNENVTVSTLLATDIKTSTLYTRQLVLNGNVVRPIACFIYINYIAIPVLVSCDLLTIVPDGLQIVTLHVVLMPSYMLLVKDASDVVLFSVQPISPTLQAIPYNPNMVRLCILDQNNVELV